MADIPTYEVDLNDSRLTGIKNEEATELKNLQNNYNTMSTNTDKYYDKLIQGYDDYAQKQTDLANQSLGLTIKEIEQNKADTEKDYTKEQSGAYVDWQQQSNQYGANAEQMAASGLSNTGFSESSQVSMYNQHQNRVATARETFNRAIVDYNNQIAQARLANDTLLAEIAFNALQKSAELSIQQVQYKNQLLQDLTTQRTAMKQSYWQRYSNMMNVIQQENELNEKTREYEKTYAENQRQFNAELAEKKRVNDSSIAYQSAMTAKAKKDAELTQAQINKLKSSGSSSGGSSSGSSGSSSGKKGKGGNSSSSGGSSIKMKTQKSTNGSSALPSNTGVGKALGLDLNSALKVTGGGAPSGKKIADTVNSGKAKEYINANKEVAFKPSANFITNNFLYSKYKF